MTKNVFMPIGTSIYNMTLLQQNLLEAESTDQDGMMKLSLVFNGRLIQCQMAISHPELLTILNDNLPERNPDEK